MENSSDIIQILGFFLVLSGVTLILVRSAVALSRGKSHRLRLSLEILLTLTVIYTFVKPALNFVGQAEFAEPVASAIAFLWLIATAFLINTVFNRFLWEGFLSDHGERRIPKLITDGIGLSIYAVAIMLALHFVYGEPIGAVLATSGAAAVVIGFGAQSTIREVFSGVALNATRALRVGDFVEIDGVYGQVYDINWRSVSLINPHTDSLYIFPNSAVAEQTILNFSEPTDRFRYYVTFSVELSAPPEMVIRSIANELKNSRYVFRDPKPNFNMLGYSEKGIDYRVRYHFDGDDPWWDAQNEIIMAIWAAMRKQGFRISMNRMLQGAPDEWPAIEERVDNRTHVSDVLKALKQHAIFGSLNDDDLTQFCKSYAACDLNPPSCFYQRGDVSDGIYLLLSGQVHIFDIGDDGVELKIDTSQPGEIFGIRAAIEQSEHRYSAQAAQYSIAVRIPRENLEKLISDKPKLKTAFEGIAKEQNVRRAVALEEEKRALLLAQHHNLRRTIAGDLRRSVDNMLNKPMLHHLLDHISSSVRHEELLEGIMAGAAKIATARGVPDDVEREYLVTTLREADLLRHLDIDHGLALFDKYSDMLLEGREKDKDLVQQALNEARRVKHGPTIVANICKGLCGVHELPTKEELEALAEVQSALGVATGSDRENKQKARTGTNPRD